MIFNHAGINAIQYFPVAKGKSVLVTNFEDVGRVLHRPGLVHRTV